MSGSDCQETNPIDKLGPTRTSAELCVSTIFIYKIPYNNPGIFETPRCLHTPTHRTGCGYYGVHIQPRLRGRR